MFVAHSLCWLYVEWCGCRCGWMWCVAIFLMLCCVVQPVCGGWVAVAAVAPMEKHSLLVNATIVGAVGWDGTNNKSDLTKETYYSKKIF